MSSSPESITLLLGELEQNRPDTVERLFALVRPRLHQIAVSLFRHERSSHTLQPTILMHDAFLRLTRQRQRTFIDSTRFFVFAARNMRQILVDYARAHNAKTRGGGVERLELEEARMVETAGGRRDFAALHDALARLEALDPRQARVVELRFLLGLSVKETAQTLRLSPTTVKADCKLARAFLRREVEDAR